MGRMGGNELEITELRLGLPGGMSRESEGERSDGKNGKKRVFPETGGGSNKSMAVGWPPVCSYRKRSIGSEKECMVVDDHSHQAAASSNRFVKISKDGVPFLRKIHVADFKDYSHLCHAIDNLFASSVLGENTKDEEKVEYVPIYEDKDGDWLLIGDVPWKMFVESCRRLRIMKKSDAKGLVQAEKL